VSSEATVAMQAPTIAPTASLAISTRRVSGLIRNVVVAVLWRNSPASMEMPTSSTSSAPADAEDITLRTPAVEPNGPMLGPAMIVSATLTGTNASAAAT
jgi:hypothetical protein